MDLARIRQALDALPTLMDLRDELRWMEQLRQLEPAEIACHESEFRFAVSRIQESHHGNGIFEVTDDNAAVFSDFGRWLRAQQSHLRTDIAPLCDGFDLTPADLRRQMPED